MSGTRKFSCIFSLLICCLSSLFCFRKSFSHMKGFQDGSPFFPFSPLLPSIMGKFLNITFYPFCVCAQSCLTTFDTLTVAHQAPLSMGFSRQEYWSGLPFPPPRDLPSPGIKPTSPALKVGSLLLIHWGSSFMGHHTLDSRVLLVQFL